MKRIALIVIVAICLHACVQKQDKPKNVNKKHDSAVFIDTDALFEDDSFISPQFPGGEKQFEKYLAKNIHYPDIAIKNNIQGKVVLNFLVKKDGSIGDIKVSRSISKDIDEEAIRVLKNSPKWKPGTHQGKPDSVHYRIPINFELPVSKSKVDTTDNKIYVAVEHEPEFPGGIPAFAKYFNKNLKVSISRDESLKTKLVIEFVVEKDGSITNIKILQGISRATDQSAIDVMRRSPKWLPGKIHGKTVRVQYAIPDIIELQEEDQ